MALTIAEVAHPNSTSTDVSLAPFKAKIIDVTFDDDYLTTGELLTAAALGWDQVHGALTLTHGANADGTLGFPVVIKRNAASTQLTLQPIHSAADGDPMDEAGASDDLSAYTTRLLVIGS